MDWNKTKTGIAMSQVTDRQEERSPVAQDYHYWDATRTGARLHETRDQSDK